MIDIEKKTHHTAYSYKNSIDKISSFHSQKTNTSIYIYSINDLSVLSDIAKNYSQTGRFASYGYEGNGTIRNAIATYVRFYEDYSQNGTNTMKQPNINTPLIRRPNTQHTNSRIRSSSIKNARYRGSAIGNSQNLFIRNILSNLGDESFTESDWNDTKNYYSNRCAYCGTEDESLVMEHAIPINKLNLGEHRLGNLVPSCKECNSKKHHSNYKDYLVDQPKELAKIQKYMEQKNYFPLESNGNSEAITEILKMAHEEIGQLAQRYIQIINKLL